MTTGDERRRRAASIIESNLVARGEGSLQDVMRVDLLGLGLDSVDLVEIADALQNEFGVAVKLDDMFGCETVEALLDAYFADPAGGDRERTDVEWEILEL
jgi:acyl carrier protein